MSDEEGDANNLEEEAANFSIKYLTSSKLMSLEVSNAESVHVYLVFYLWQNLYILVIQKSSYRLSVSFILIIIVGGVMGLGNS